MIPGLPERYRSLSAEGAGSFAVVHRGFDTELRIEVAIKVLASNWTRNDAVVKDFVAEARRLRRLSLPSVIDVHDLGTTAEGSPFMVMDFADGGSLKDRIDWLESRGWTASQHLETVASFVERVGEMLGAFHEAGFTHRDLKPGNLLLISTRSPASAPPLVSRNECVVLGDVGLAARHEDAQEPSGTRGYRSESLVGLRGDLSAASAIVLRILCGPEPPSGAAAWHAIQRLRDDPPDNAADWVDRILDVLATSG